MGFYAVSSDFYKDFMKICINELKASGLCVIVVSNIFGIAHFGSHTRPREEE